MLSFVNHNVDLPLLVGMSLTYFFSTLGCLGIRFMTSFSLLLFVLLVALLFVIQFTVHVWTCGFGD